MLDQQVSLTGYPGSIRQLAVTELGHDKPTLLLTNQTHETPTRLVDCHARRLLIEHQASRTLFRKFVHGSADLAIDERTITVQFGRRANNPFLVKQGFPEQECSIPWLGNRAYRFTFGENGSQNVTSQNAVRD